MSYTDELKGKLFEFFMKKGYTELKPGWLTGPCPDCGDDRKGKYALSIESNRSNCWICGCKDKPLIVVQKLEGIKTLNEVYKVVDAFKGFKYVSGPARKIEPKLKPKTFSLPPDFKLVGIYNNRYAKIVEKNLKRRGFNINRLMMAGVGYCTTGDYAHRIIFPYFEKGKLIYFNARALTSGALKFKNPSVEECGIGKENIIYNIDALYLYKKVYICESVTNALTLGSHATATGGKSLSEWQIMQYINAPCQEIVICLDDDGYDLALRLAMRISQHKKVKVLRFPEGQDVNDIGRSATREIEKKTPYKTYKELYKDQLSYKYD